MTKGRTVSAMSKSTSLEIFAAVMLTLFAFAIPLANVPALVMGTMTLYFAFAFFSGYRRAPTPKVFLIILPYSLFCLATLLWSFDPAETWKYLRREVLLPAVVFIAFYCLSKSTDYRWLVLGSILGLASVLLAITAGSFGLSADAAIKLQHYDPGVGDLSTYAVILLPVLFLFLLKSSLRKAGKWLIGIAFLGLVTVTGYLTENRMFWPTIGLTLLTIVTLWLLSRRRPMKTRHMLALVVALLMTAALAIGFAFTPKNAPNPDNSSIEHIEDVASSDPRWAIWRFWLELIKERPWLGYGYGRFIAQQHTDASAPSEDAWAPSMGHGHNIFLNRISEGGAIGAGFFVLMWFLLGNEYRKGLRTPHSRFHAIAGISLIVAFLVKGITDDFYTRQNLLFFWAIQGMWLSSLHTGFLHSHRDKRGP